jgi:hypothetical protein
LTTKQSKKEQVKTMVKTVEGTKPVIKAHLRLGSDDPRLENVSERNARKDEVFNLSDRLAQCFRPLNLNTEEGAIAPQ